MWFYVTCAWFNRYDNLEKIIKADDEIELRKFSPYYKS